MQNSKTNIEKIKKLAWTLSLASGMKCLDVPGEYVWAYPGSDPNGSTKFNDVRQRMKSIFSSGNSIKDQEIINFIQQSSINKFLLDPWTVQKYEENWVEWIKRNNNDTYILKNLDLFNVKCYSQGTQESFLNFYMMNKDKRFRVFKGDYWWHMDIWTKLNLNWEYIENADIIDNDVCIVSCPFALTGKRHEKFYELLDICERKGVDILIDLIYLPNSMNHTVNIDLSRDCIKQITFSLSKTFPVQCAKVAIRLSKFKIGDPMEMSNDENISNRLAAGLGLLLMEKFPLNYMAKKYKSSQNYWCNKLGLESTDVVHFAIGDSYLSFDQEERFISPFNIQDQRYNLGMLYENQNLINKCNL